MANQPSRRKRTTALFAAVGVGLSGVALTAGPAAADPPPQVQVSVVSDDLGVSNVVPTWGAQIPKVVYDGEWYYAATLDGDGAQHPWSGQVWQSDDGSDWTPVVRLPGHLYQPIGLLIDGEGDLHLQVACYTGATCYPGVDPAPGADMAAVYPVRLEFSSRLADGSIDFDQFSDHTIRSAGSERYYQGLAMDPTGQYLYSAYAVGNWDLYLNVLDTISGVDVSTTLIGTPPEGRAWLYPRVQPGPDGDVSLTFSQYILGTPGSAYLDAALLATSADHGQSFAIHTLTAQPDPDGDANWVDASDLTVDAAGELHTVFYQRDAGVGTLYYQAGVTGTPVPVGDMDNHSQILVDPDGQITIFSSEANNLVVATSSDGADWTIEHHEIAGVTGAYWPNLLSARSGSATPAGWDGPQPTTGMLMAGQSEGSSAFSPLLFVTYHATSPVPAEPTVTVDPGRVRFGGSVKIELSGFEPGQHVTVRTVWLHGTSVALPTSSARLVADDSGTAKTRVSGLSLLLPGPYAVTATVDRQVVAIAGLTVTLRR